MTHPFVSVAPRRRPAVGILLLAVGLLAALLLPASALADEPKYVVQDSATSCQNPDVSGDLFVWEDTGSDTYGEIWAKLSGGSPFLVANAAWHQTWPAVDGTTVVWQDDRANSGVYRIRGAVVDPGAGTASAFDISSAVGSDTDPDISGRYVVWTRQNGSSYDIYGFDLLTQTEFPICTNTAKQFQPAVSGDLVVWTDYRNNTYNLGDIYAARISFPGHGISEFPVRRQIEAPMYQEVTPAVSGSTVVWQDGRSTPSPARIYAATVTGTSVSDEWQVSQTTNRTPSNPSVNGTLIAWTYNWNSTLGLSDDVYARRVGQPAEFPIASTSRYEKTPAVGAAHTVWTYNETWDIHAADVGGFGWSAGVAIDGGAQHAMARDVTLGLSASSSVGQATAMCFSNDGALWSDWEAYATTRAWQLTSGDGSKTVYAKFRDAEANVSPVKSDTIVLDENAPVTVDDAPLGWQTGPVDVTLTADDGGGSGVIGTVYDLDDAGNDTYTGPIPVSGDGVHTLVYRSADAVGRAEEPKVIQVWIDGTAPVTTDDAGDGWHASGFALHLAPYDAYGIERTEYSVDGGDWQTGMTAVFGARGKKSGAAQEFVVQYRSVDVAGNVEETRTCTVRIDARRPVTADDYDGLPHSTDLLVILEGFDEHSGVLETWYSLDGADPVLGTSVLVPAPADGTNDGPHVITYFSVDGVGNRETARAVTVAIAAGGGAAQASASPEGPGPTALPRLLKSGSLRP